MIRLVTFLLPIFARLLVPSNARCWVHARVGRKILRDEVNNWDGVKRVGYNNDN